MIGFNALSAAWWFFLLVPLIILYFLKLKRPQIRIPSLFLWQQVINDSRVNSPFQRFKKHILLLLQVLILMLLVLAAMRPYYHSVATKAQRIPIIIDTSASMGALDKKNGITRLDLARQKIREMIENKTSEQEFAVISFSNTAIKRTGFTGNNRVLLDTLDKLKVDDVAADIEDALRMVQAIARNYPFDEAILLSDGNFPEKSNFNLSFKLNYQKLPSGGPNIGITKLTARRAGDNNWSIFVRINATKDASPADVQLVVDGKTIASETFLPSRQTEERMVFQIDGGSAKHLEIKVVAGGFDSLSSDNVAYLDLPLMRPLNVYVSPGLNSCRAAIEGIDGVRLYPEPGRKETEMTGFDLMIADSEQKLSGDCVTEMSMGIIPDRLKDLIIIKKDSGGVVDWAKTAPLLLHVELTDLVVIDSPVLKNDSQDVNTFDSLGYEVLIHGTAGPLLLKRSWTGRLQYHLLFYPDKSTFPYRIGFPVMMSNLVRIAMKNTGLSEVNGNCTGVLPNIRLQADKRYQVKTSGGETLTGKTDKNGMLYGVPAQKTGTYKIYENGTLIASVGVGLLQEDETSLEGVKTIKFNELSVQAENAPAKVPRSLWWTIAFLAFWFLVVEWWFYQKRPGGLFLK